MGRGKGKKDPFDMLDTETKSAIEGGDEASINTVIANVAKNQAALEDVKAKDQDLKNAKDQVKSASFVYTEGRKRNRQVIAYCRLVLDGKGKDSGDAGLVDPDPEPDQTPEEAAERQAQVDARG
jgi:hypothetical protein